ncbi:MAG: hypothetical protein R2849_16050 [Thermomicrobiales bacterium]
MSTMHPRVRLVELVATLSLGTDLGLGQPMEHVMRQTLLALRMAERLSLALTTAHVYYALDCSPGWSHTDAYEQAKWLGDDITVWRKRIFDWSIVPGSATWCARSDMGGRRGLSARAGAGALGKRHARPECHARKSLAGRRRTGQESLNACAFYPYLTQRMLAFFRSTRPTSTLILVGDRDRFCSPEQAVHDYRHLPHVELAIVPNTGHWISHSAAQRPSTF